MPNGYTMPIQLLRKKQNPNAVLRVVCLHHAAGSVPLYLNWQDYLPDFIELYALQLPGRGSSLREPVIKDIDKAVNEIAQLIHNEIAEPYVLFGHSLGTLLGFETIRYLDKNNMKLPAHFFASGLGAPHVLSCKHRRDLMSEKELLAVLASYDKDRVVQSDAYYDLLKLILPAAFADFKMHDTYVHQQGNFLPCPITAIAGTHDEDHQPQTIEAWRQLTAKEYLIKFFEGGHMYFMDHPTPFLDWFSEQLQIISQKNALLP